MHKKCASSNDLIAMSLASHCFFNCFFLLLLFFSLSLWVTQLQLFTYYAYGVKEIYSMCVCVCVSVFLTLFSWFASYDLCEILSLRGCNWHNHSIFGTQCEWLPLNSGFILCQQLLHGQRTREIFPSVCAFFLNRIWSHCWNWI